MAPKESAFNRFSGLAAGIMRWAGARRSGNAASIPANMFRDLENVRFEGQDITCRGGQTKYNLDAVLEGCIDGFIPPEYEPPTTGEPYFLVSGYDSVRGIGSNGTNVPLSIVRGFSANLTGGVLEDTVSLNYIAGAGAGGSGGRIHWGANSWDGVDVTSAFYSIDSNGDLSSVSSNSVTLSGDGCFGMGASFDGENCETYSRNGGGTGESGVIVGGVTERTVAGTDAEHGSTTPPWLLEDDSIGVLVAPLSDTELHYRDDMAVWATATMTAGDLINRSHIGNAAAIPGGIIFSGSRLGGATIFLITAGVISVEVSLGTTPPFYQPVCRHLANTWFVNNIAGTGLGKRTIGGTISSVLTIPGSDPIVQLISADGVLYALRTNSIWASDNPDYLETWRQVGSTLANAYWVGCVARVL